MTKEIKINPEIAVLITSHPMQHRWMNRALESWEGFGNFILLGYDSNTMIDLPIHDFCPPVNDIFITGKKPGELGHYRGELWQMKMGGKILAEKGYKYIYKTAADNTCYRWRNLQKIYEYLVNKHFQFICCGTTQIFAELEIFNQCMALWSDDVTRCGGAECFLNHQLKELKVRDCRQKVPWWNEQLGLIHLQGEYALNNNLSIFDTWAIGQLWGDSYKHRDLEPRLKFLNPQIREKYVALREEKKDS